jgi:hypothetical protein
MDMFVILTVSYTPPNGLGEGRSGIRGIFAADHGSTEATLFDAVWDRLPEHVRAAGPLVLFYRAVPVQFAAELGADVAKEADR